MATILHRLHPVLQSSRRSRDAIEQVPSHGGFPETKKFKDICQCIPSLLIRHQGVLGVVQGVGTEDVRYMISLLRARTLKVNNDTDNNLTLTLTVTLIVQCIFCRMLDAYVPFSTLGSTITKFRTRFNNYKSRRNAHTRLSAQNKLVAKDFFIANNKTSNIQLIRLKPGISLYHVQPNEAKYEKILDTADFANSETCSFIRLYDAFRKSLLKAAKNTLRQPTRRVEFRPIIGLISN